MTYAEAMRAAYLFAADRGPSACVHVIRRGDGSHDWGHGQLPEIDPASGDALVWARRSRRAGMARPVPHVNPQPGPKPDTE